MQWVNPHSRLTLDVTGPDGAVVNWTVEFGAVEALLRRGWKKTDLAVGAEVTIRGYLARDGSHVAGRNVTLADGSKLLGRASVTPGVRVQTAVYTLSDRRAGARREVISGQAAGQPCRVQRHPPSWLGSTENRSNAGRSMRQFAISTPGTVIACRRSGETSHWQPARGGDRQHLLAQQAQAKRLDVSEADVQEEMQQVRGEYPSPEAFKKAVGDMSPERFRQRTRRTLQAARVLKAEIDPTISVSEAEAKAFYDENLSRFAEGKRTPPPFADLRKTITTYLADQKREQKTDAFVKELKARAKSRFSDAHSPSCLQPRMLGQHVLSESSRNQMRSMIGYAATAGSASSAPMIPPIAAPVTRASRTATPDSCN